MAAAKTPNRSRRRFSFRLWFGLASLCLLAILVAFFSCPEDEYEAFRKFRPQEVWITSGPFVRQTQRPLHGFRFSQTLTEFGDIVGFSERDALSYSRAITSDDISPLLPTVKQPRLPSGKFVAVVPSREAGFLWELRIPDDDPGFAGIVAQIKRRLGW
jgi:hypothetical protein